jgi:hypothetical protein
MKVKIFEIWDVTSQEREVNKWLEENKNVVIQHTLQSSAVIESNIYTQITVFYSELAFEKVK